MKSFVALAVLCLALATANAANWAVLVAGSNEYYNYRHQADVFHAYQSLIAKGFNPNNIITFAYDDIATSRSNPFHGQVFNFPSPNKPGKDVYAGVKIDYKGKDVTPQNFLDCLIGAASLKKKGFKVLESTAEDNVFIFFSDHGSTGLIAFPTKYLYAKELIENFKIMNNLKMYKQLVFYLEACESGSMFQNLLPNNTRIYATTASNAVESSWATYCHPDDKIDGKTIGSCLGDLYSVTFLEDLDAANVWEETLDAQFNTLVKKTTASHVQRYGDLEIATQVIGNFLAGNSSSAKTVSTPRENLVGTRVSSRLNKLHFLYTRFVEDATFENYNALVAEKKSIDSYDKFFKGLVQDFGLNVEAEIKDIDFDCLKQRVSLFEEIHGKLSDYGLQYVKNIHFTCSQGVSLAQYQAAVLRGSN